MGQLYYPPYDPQLLYNNRYPFYNYANQLGSPFSYQPNSMRSVLQGLLSCDDTMPIPYGSRVTISLEDVSYIDAPPRAVNQVYMYGSYRFPIAYELSYENTQINPYNQYSMNVRIEKDGNLLYVNDGYTSVKLTPTPVKRRINITLKKLGTSASVNNVNSSQCEQSVDVGLCKASILQ
ncbi:unnamed protein product, partial [Didymodactylos carnosus]